MQEKLSARENAEAIVTLFTKMFVQYGQCNEYLLKCISNKNNMVKYTKKHKNT